MNVQFADQQPTPMPPSMLHGTEINVPPSPADPLGSTQALILEHLPMVRFIARRMYERLPQHTELDDLISAGLLGLVDAASKFDGTKQIQFKSYAQHRIRGAILDSLRLLDWSPRDLRRKGRAIAETTRKLSAQLSRMPTDEEIAEEMGLSLEGLQQLTGSLKALEITSLNVERCDDSLEEEMDAVEAVSEGDPLSLYLQNETREQLAAAIEVLPEKERLVLSLYYYEHMTMREIGFTLGVVESRVSQIRVSALAHLRAWLTGSRKRVISGSPSHASPPSSEKNVRPATKVSARHSR